MSIAKRSLLAQCQIDDHGRVRKIVSWHSSLPRENRADIVENWLAQLLDQTAVGLDETTLFSASLPALMSGKEVDIQLEPLEAGLRRVSIYCELSQSSFSARSSTDRMAAVFDSLYKSSLDALITIDTHGNIIEFNRSAETMFGYKREEVHGVSVAEIVIPHALRDAHHAGMQRYLASGKGPVINTRIEVEAIRRDGSQFPCELTVVPAEINGETAFFSAFIRDISARKSAEEALNRAKQAAESASEAKSRFLAHMSHEIRSPVSAVLGCLDLLTDSTLDREQKKLVQTAEDSGQNLLGLIEDVLTFSKIESGTYQLQTQVFNPIRLMEQVIEAAAIRCAGKHLHLGCCIDPSVPTEVESDPSALRQIVSNLVDNAIKFTETGGVSIRLFADSAGKDATHTDLRIVVEDTGLGIDPESQEGIFEEFGQVDSSDRAEYGGTGLGLAICKRLLDALGGHITLDSRLGVGSRFQVILPCEKTADASPYLPPDYKFPKVALHCTNVALRQDVVGQLSLLKGDLSLLDSPENIEDALFIVESDSDADVVKNVLSQWQGVGVEPERLILALYGESATVTAYREQWPVKGILSQPLTAKALLRSLSSEQAGAQQSTPAATETKTLTKPYKILLAEDSKANQLIAMTMLTKAGYQVDVADNGQQAIDAAGRGNYDAILMDLRMPQVDGLTATKVIREQYSFDELPIIALTANVFGSDVERCFEAGMNDFLGKPVNRERLLSVLENWFEGTKQVSGIAMEEQSELMLDLAQLQQLASETSDEAVAVILQAFEKELDSFETVLNTCKQSDSLSNDDLSTLREIAHRCKSSAGYCGAQHIQKLAAQLEKECIDQDSESVAQSVGEVLDCLQATRQAIYAHKS